MRTIASLLYPDVMSLDVSGPLQVFASANVELRRLGQAEAYRLLVLGEHAGPWPPSAGFQLVHHRLPIERLRLTKAHRG